MSRPAFSLIELLIVIAIVAILMAVGFAISSQVVVNQALRASAEQVEQQINRAHIYAREARNNELWTVKINADKTSYQLVRGAEANQTVDSAYTLKRPATFVTAPVDIKFAKGTGYTVGNVSYSLTLMVPSGKTAVVNVSPFGLVSRL